jgi:outer membrane autotransporter protein
LANTLSVNDYTQQANTTFELNNTSDHGKLVVAGTRTLTNKTVVLDLASTATIANGDTFTIFSDTGAGDVEATDFTFSNLSYSNLLTFTADSTADDNLVLTAVVSGFDDAATDAGAGYLGGAAAAIQAIGSSGDANFDAFYSRVLNSSNDAAAAELIESVVPTVDGGALVGSIEAGGQAIGTVDGRIASLSNGTGISAGNGGPSGGRFWAQAFGQAAEQDKRDGVDGYDSDTAGFTVGVDNDQIAEGVTLGVAISYGNTDVDSANAASTETDIDSYQGTLYAAYDLGDAAYVNGLVAYGRNNIDQVRYNVGGSGLSSSADYSSNQYTAKIDGGKTFTVDGDVNFTPNALLQWTYVDTDSYTETGAGTLSLSNVSTDDLHKIEIGAGVTVDKSFDLGNSETFTPEARVGVRYDVVGDSVETTGAFTGAGASFKTEGFDPAKVSANAGVGFTYSSNANFDLKAQYDYTVKSDYDAHAGSVKGIFKF